VAIAAGKTPGKICGILQLGNSKNKAFCMIMKISVKRKMSGKSLRNPE
jgi:hypothetical protein